MNSQIQDALGSFRVFRERNFRLFTVGQMFSQSGSMVQAVVESQIVLVLSGSAFQVCLIWVFNYLPGALFAPFAGVVLNRFDNRKVLYSTSAVGIIQSLIMAYWQYGNSLTVGRIEFMAFVMGTINAFDTPCRNSIIPETIEDKKSNLDPASPVFSIVYNLGQAIGPVTAVALVSMFGYAGAFVFNAASFLPLVIALWMMKLEPRNVRPSKGHIFEQVRESGRWVFSNRTIRMCLSVLSVSALFGFSIQSVLGPAGRAMFGFQKIDGYGYLATANSFGCFVASFLVFLFSGRLPFRLFVIGGNMLAGFALVLFTFVSNAWLSRFCIMFVGLGFIVTFATIRVRVFRECTLETKGGIMGYYVSFFYSGMVIGFLLGGLIAKFAGCPAVFITYGIGLLILALFVKCLKTEN